MFYNVHCNWNGGGKVTQVQNRFEVLLVVAQAIIKGKFTELKVEASEEERIKIEVKI